MSVKLMTRLFVVFVWLFAIGLIALFVWKKKQYDAEKKRQDEYKLQQWRRNNRASKWKFIRQNVTKERFDEIVQRQIELENSKGIIPGSDESAFLNENYDTFKISEKEI